MNKSLIEMQAGFDEPQYNPKDVAFIAVKKEGNHDPLSDLTVSIKPTAHADLVNNPAHYQSESGIECIEAIRAQLTPEEFRGYCKGNIAKYVWRERQKGGTESLRKAEWYLKQITEQVND